MECRTLLLRFEAPSAAEAARVELEIMWKEHQAWLEKNLDHGWELTPPQLSFAERVGFAWDDSDRLVIDGLPEDVVRSLDLGVLGRLLIFSHAACRGLMEVGMKRFARERGATHFAFWDPDPEPEAAVIRISAPTSLADRLEELCEEWSFEGEWNEEDEEVAGRLVLDGRTLVAQSGWGLAGVLLGLGRVEGVEADLENGSPLSR